MQNLNRNWHNLEIKEVLKTLNVGFETGLLEKEVIKRRKAYGSNELPEEKRLSKLQIFLEQFKSPLIYVLVVAGSVTLFLHDYTDTIIIYGAVLLNVFIGFFQENKTSKTLQELKKVVKYTAEVRRDGNFEIVDSSELVPGDIIVLNPGDKVPADARVLKSHELKINEMALTGEWLSSTKEKGILEEDTPLADRENMVYMGTIAEEGKAMAVVVATGINTEIGRIAGTLRGVKEEKTSYQKKLARFAKVLGSIIVFISFFIFLFGIIGEREFVEMFTITVALAVAAIPEGLPVATTVVFTFGMREILKKKGLVKKLVAAETLGSTSVICADKTGTLTEGKMEVAKIFSPYEILYYKNSQDKAHILALKISALNSEAFIENVNKPIEKWVARGRPTDRALLVAATQAGINKKEIESKELKIDEILFKSKNKYSATLYQSQEKDKFLYLMGAPEIILEKSKFFQFKDEKKKIDSESLKKLREKYIELMSQGFRVIAVSYKKDNEIGDKLSEENLEDVVFVGLIALHDPIRKETHNAINTCREAGMRPIIITGDHKLTAKAVAEKIGFKVEEKNILEGKELEKLSDEEFQKILKDIHIYARIAPEQKLRIVQAWQEAGEVVAMTGDGVNDAPALRKANIGVALGSGTEVAKEASDLTLLSDDFGVIIVAIEEGRRIIDNIRKIITYLLAGGFGEIMLVSLAVIFQMPLPVLAGQILWKNLIESTPPAMALTFEEKEKDIMKRKPEPLHLPLFTGEMKALTLIIGVGTGIIRFGLFLWLLRIGIPIDQIRTIIFASLAIDSFLFIFSCRSLRRNIWHYNPFSNIHVLFTILIAFFVLLASIYLPPLQHVLQTAPLGIFGWLVVFGFGLLVFASIELAKYWFIVKHKV
jgi:P-type Ca2+ transporter type 2C